VLPVLAGRVAVITGASRGLGAGLATHFADAGLLLGLCARTRPGSAEGPSEDSAAEPLRTAVDVTDYAGLSAFTDAVVARFGRIDLWVNNAGVLDPIGPLAEVEPADAARNISINVMGVLNGSSLFARHVRSRPGGGVLLNISSGASTTPYAGWGPYCAAKAAVDQLTRVLALEEATHGLAAYAVAPGVIDTDMQAMVRSTDERLFPAVERFRQLAVDDAFNSADWVAGHLLQIAFGDERPEQVVVRLPAEPTTSRSQ
jgi:NAD(P)-dependent dehydrogenase (short-subunit alcohol dehydrogenase family)